MNDASREGPAWDQWSMKSPPIPDTTKLRLQLLSAFNLHQWLFFSPHSGQFLYQDAQLIEAPAVFGKNLSDEPTPQTEEMPEAILKVKGRRVPVVWKQRKIYNGQEQVDCWFDRNNAAKLIDGVYKDYLAAHPFDTQNTLDLSMSRRAQTGVLQEDGII